MPVLLSDFLRPLTRELNRIVPLGNSPARTSRRTFRSTARKSCGLFQEMLPLVNPHNLRDDTNSVQVILITIFQAR
jgi:hypothetical protein